VPSGEVQPRLGAPVCRCLIAPGQQGNQLNLVPSEELQLGGAGRRRYRRVEHARPAPTRPLAGTPRRAGPGRPRRGAGPWSRPRFCSTTFPATSFPRLVAGAPATDDILQCQQEAVSAEGYDGKLTTDQLKRLRQIFPEEVCDDGKPSQNASRFLGTWLSFGGR
jgi:hypothetical protein